MKNLILTLIMLLALNSNAQTFTANETPVGLEHNTLFNANTRYNVTQTGSASLNLATLFDGRFAPSYTSIGPTTQDPTVILIEGLTNTHIQLGGWVGWATRYWEPKRFKIEGYDSYQSVNVWKTIVDYSAQDYTGGKKFIQKITSPGSYTKLRYTFFSGTGTNDRLGVSELYFIHPEGTGPYEGLLSSSTASNHWNNNNSDLYYSAGNIGIGTSTPSSKLELYGGGDLLIKGATNDAGDLVFQTNNSLQLGRIWSSTSGDSGLYLSSGDNISDLAISSTGDIGIGTLNTKGFKLGVQGKIAAEEVKVAIYSNWADFVFNNNYNLPTLKEVEQHIKEKGHLKDIPSAKDVKENGIFLGGMDAKLLQKIEELMLYTIEQEKRIENLESKIEKLLQIKK